MLYGSIYSEGHQHLHPVLKKAIDFLKETDFSNMEPQKIEIDGDTIFANILSTTSNYVDEKKVEAHKKYIDIQFSPNGGEVIGCCPVSDELEVTNDRLEEKDVINYADGIDEEFLVMEKGSYGIFFPTDAHRPGCCLEEPEDIQKVVVKVKYEALK